MKIKLNNNHNHKFGTKTAFSLIRNIRKEHYEFRCNECRMHMNLPYVLTFKHSHDVNIKRFKVQEMMRQHLGKAIEPEIQNPK